MATSRKVRTAQVGSDVPRESEQAGSLALGILPSLCGFHLRRAQLAAFRDFDAVTGGHGLTPALFHILVLIENNPGLPQSDVANSLGADRSTIVPMMKRLEANGWIERRANPSDGRAHALVMTPRGQTVLDDAAHRLRAHDQALMNELSPSEQTKLLDFLRRIASATYRVDERTRL